MVTLTQPVTDMYAQTFIVCAKEKFKLWDNYPLEQEETLAHQSVLVVQKRL
jgi:hypothetical protein